jgi:predicted Zn-dependent protease
MWQFLQLIGRFIWGILFTLRWVIVALLAIGLPVYIYLAFIADEPVFSAENDLELGRMTEQSIAADPEQYPLLSEEEFPQAYARMRSLVNRLLKSPEIQYRDLFAYDDVKIIHDDEVLNAFCAPGGFIYVFSGLMRYLESEDHLAGVLGHEIAHAELRHSSLRLQKEHGVKRLLDFILLSSPVTVGDAVNASILEDLLSLDYSRDQEAQADDYSVRYLATSGYACDGTAGFFAKLLAEGQDVKIPEFLSDHPASEARVTDIRRAAQELGCSTQLGDPSGWRAFQASLPPEATEGAGAGASSD